jgi:hypothetical protein
MLKNDSMNLLLDARYLVTVAAIIVWMHNRAIVMHVYTCHQFLSKIMSMCLIMTHILDGVTHSQLSQQVWSDR